MDKKTLSYLYVVTVTASQCPPFHRRFMTGLAARQWAIRFVKELRSQSPTSQKSGSVYGKRRVVVWGEDIGHTEVFLNRIDDKEEISRWLQYHLNDGHDPQPEEAPDAKG